jgi:hypothetical protein
MLYYLLRYHNTINNLVLNMTQIHRDNLSIDEINKKQKDLDDKIKQLKEKPDQKKNEGEDQK